MTEVAAASDQTPVRPGRALAWSFLNTAVGRFGTIAIGIVLARLLGPAEFGTYAVAFVALMAILSFNELGVSLAIVRWEDDPAEIAPTVTTIALVMSGLLTALAMLVAPWFAGAMGDPGAAGLIRLLSLCVLINGAVAAPAALMQRLFRQGQRMTVDQVNVWLGAVVSILLAAAGAGAMSLVVGRLAGAAVSALLFLHYSPLPYRLGLDRRLVRPLLGFGLPLAGASIIVFLVGFVDQVIVGHVLGAALLGYYVLATNLAGWPLTLFSQPLRSVAPALFARLQHDPHLMSRSFDRVLRPLAGVALPACAALAAAAPELVRFVYGAEWAPAGVVLRWLAILAGLRILFELAYDYVVVLGRSSAILQVQLAWVAVLAPTLWVSVHRSGLDAAAPAAVGVAVVVTAPLYLWVLRRSRLEARQLGRSLIAPGLAAIACLCVGLAVGDAVDSNLGCVALIGAVAGVAAGTLLWRSRDDLRVFAARSI